jgi:hypothetical protein
VSPGRERRLSVAELESAFLREVVEDRRAAAETAYALACRYQTEYVEGCMSPSDVARGWAIRSIELLDSLRSDTVEQVSSLRQSVGGVELPDLLHSGVVRNRLSDVLRSSESLDD